VWTVAEPYLVKAVEGDFDIDVYRKSILSRDMQLWSAVKDGKFVAFMVTEIIQRPRKKICNIQLAGGVGVKDWIRHMPKIEEWAASEGCDAIETFTSRKRWTRLLPEWSEAGVTIRKELRQ
jgi:hypothetical protein